ncbi:MAG: SusC/RagA family TonB-linked outer membrane protein [Bacteroidales bacterium]|nr:SusC/RagA family TonB-linked outer membrane protein [Bacteroidales bacterium]
MKVFNSNQGVCVKNGISLKILKIMRNMLILLFLPILQSIAGNSYSQSTTLSLDLEDVSIKEALIEIEEQSEFFFAYNAKLVDVQRRVDISVKDQPILDILAKIFSDSDVDYLIMDRQILLSQKKYLSESLKMMQTRTVTGSITDENGDPIIGASVRLKGTNSGTISNLDGIYSIEVVDANSVLQFSFVGYVSQEVTVGNQTSIDINLELDVMGLEEVVVIGYGTIKKSDLTGSVSSVKGDDIDSYPAVTNVMNKLTGHTTGVYVMQNTGEPGSAFSVQIRGANSIQGSNEPLYVLDGFLTTGSSLDMLNSLDIESVEVLKDASATAIYGSRGANGVVLITTKQGKSGKTTLEFESSFGSQSLSKKLDLMNATEYAQLYNEQAVNDGLAPYFSPAEISAFGSGFDWQDFIFQNALISNNTLSLNGGSEKTRFSISGNVLNQNGIIKGTGFKRYSLKAVLAPIMLAKFKEVNNSCPLPHQWGQLQMEVDFLKKVLGK